MKELIARPVNETQRRFNELCQLGGGRKGGPARTRVQELLHRSGTKLNAYAHQEVMESLSLYGDHSPWHICFAIGLAWGHLAVLDQKFVGAAVRALADWNDDDVNEAKAYHYERGPEPIVQSLSGGHVLFSKVRLPDQLPTTIAGYRRAQDRWLGVIIGPERPRYIGSWNATAMFMVALFSNPDLAAEMKEPEIMLPPGGPIYAGLSLLHQAHILAQPPSGSELDDQQFEPGAIYENNALFAEILKGRDGWSLLDVHSGLYMLGTRLQGTDQWFE